MMLNSAKALACLFKFQLATFLLPAILFVSTAAYAATYYVDTSGGNDFNDGLSPSTAWRTVRESKRGDEIVFIDPDNLSKQVKTSSSAFPGTPVIGNRDALEMNRLVLGAEQVTGWSASSPNIWKASLEITPPMENVYITSDGQYLVPGCAKDFLKDGESYWDGSSVYMSDADGNPDVTGKTITAEVHDSGQIVRTVIISGWLYCPPTVFQSGFGTNPMHLMLDDSFYDDWWWGPTSCFLEVSGDQDTLYIRIPDGNPDTTGKEVCAVAKSAGWSVTSGDFNGDGIRDVVHSNYGPEIYVNYGKSDFSPMPDQVLLDPDGESVLGFYIASAGDVNRDGFDDLLVSMDWGVNKVYLYMGFSSGLSDRPDVVIYPPNGYPAFGFGHAISFHAGDVNGDGFSDILIGTNGYWCVYYGSAIGLSVNPDAIVDSDGGSNVSFVGDINNDGFDDIAVQSDISDVYLINFYLYNGSPTGIDITKSTIVSIPNTSLDTINNLAFAKVRDLNGDGIDDLLVGSQFSSDTYLGEGKAYIFYGSPAGLATFPDLVINNPQPSYNVRFGQSVDGIGDFNYDGFNDIIIGCPYGNDNKGYAAIYYGSPDGISDVPHLILDGAGNFDDPGSLGWSVSHVGDINGKGQNFIIVGEEFGASFLYALERSTRAPVAEFTGNPTSGTAPLQVSFTNKSIGNITGCLWDFGDGQTSTNQNPTHTYNDAGSYTVSLTVTGPAGDDVKSNVGYIVVANQTGSICVTISPQPAIDRGAQWRVDGGAWQNSGATVAGLVVEAHTIQFKELQGWTKPADQIVTVASDQTTASSGAYKTSLPIISIIAVQTQASEGGSDGGRLILFRTGSADRSLAVKYVVGGSSAAGVDYIWLNGTATIPAHSSSATITVIPRDDKIFEGDEVVSVTLSEGPSYLVGSPSSASVTITDNDPPLPAVSIVATDPNASEAGLDTGRFALFRTGNTNKPLTVRYNVGGTTRNGKDYRRLSGRISFPAGQASSIITVRPIDDKIEEADETVVVTLSTSPAYQIDSASSASVTITDND